MTRFHSPHIDTALTEVKATYARLVEANIDPAAVVIAMSEVIAFSLAHKAVTGGGTAETLRAWRVPFESAYHQHISAIEQKAGK